jgi:hypothetical protein
MQQLTRKLSYKVGSAKGINEWEKALSDFVCKLS